MRARRRWQAQFELAVYTDSKVSTPPPKPARIWLDTPFERIPFRYRGDIEPKSGLGSPSGDLTSTSIRSPTTCLLPPRGRRLGTQISTRAAPSTGIRLPPISGRAGSRPSAPRRACSRRRSVPWTSGHNPKSDEHGYPARKWCTAITLSLVLERRTGLRWRDCRSYERLDGPVGKRLHWVRHMSNDTAGAPRGGASTWAMAGATRRWTDWRNCRAPGKPRRDPRPPERLRGHVAEPRCAEPPTSERDSFTAPSTAGRDGTGQRTYTVSVHNRGFTVFGYERKPLLHRRAARHQRAGPGRASATAPS